MKPIIIILTCALLVGCSCGAVNPVNPSLYGVGSCNAVNPSNAAAPSCNAANPSNVAAPSCNATNPPNPTPAVTAPVCYPTMQAIQLVPAPVSVAPTENPPVYTPMCGGE